MLQILVRGISLLPFSFLYLLSDLLGPLLFTLYRRRIVERNLGYCFPHFSPKEKARVARAFYRNMMDVVLETCKSLSMFPEDFDRRVKFVKDATYEEIHQNEGGVIVFSSHQCNWEWLAIQGGRELGNVFLLYKTLHNRAVDKLMSAIRGSSGNTLVSTQQIRELAHRKGEYDVLAILADQTPTRRNPAKVWAKFMGKPTPFYQGTFVVPYLLQIPSYYVSMRRNSRGYYTAKFQKLGAPPYGKGDHGLLLKYIDCMEEDIIASPSDWLWSHNRWKYERKDTEVMVEN